MKKLILIVVFFLSIYPSLNKGNIQIRFSQEVYAQSGNGSTACSDPSGLGCTGNTGGGFREAANKVLNAIASFFKNIGELFNGGEDDEEEDWEPINPDDIPELAEIEPYDPWADPENIYGGSGGSTGGPYDPFSDPYFLLVSQAYGNQYGGGYIPTFTLDCKFVINGTAYIDNCYRCVGGTTGLTPCTPPAQRYFTTVNNDTTRYYDNDTIYIPQRNVQAKITIHKENSTLAPANLIWKRNDTTKCTAALNCLFASNPLGVFMVKVDSGNIKTLIKNPVVVYKTPTLYFKIGLNYKGEYGFDDSAHLHPRILNNSRYNLGTKIKTFGQDTSYRIPWVSLLDQQTATIRDSLVNLSNAAKKDKNGYIEFKQSIISNNKILMFGSNNPRFYYSTLNPINTFNIYAQRWNQNVESLRKAGNFNDIISNIYAITNTGDTIGQMRLSCDIATPKKVVFIYVNTGRGYRNISKQVILDSLNKNSHNQVLRKWVLDSSIIKHSNGRDTIDLRSEFTLDSTKFMNPDTLLRPTRIDAYYLNHKNIDINYGLNSGINIISDNPNKVHVVFIFNYSLFINGGGDIAASDAGGFRSMWWVDTDYKAAAHEMGHLLNMAHVWTNVSAMVIPNSSVPGYLIPKYSTKNLMDYANVSPDPTEMFYFAQWANCF
jgi:hypothetical protein